MQADAPTLERSLLLEEARVPISESSPCGEDLTWSEDFLQVKNEIDKLDGVDYAFIVEASREMLRSRSKDLRIAGYLAVGLYRTRRLSGMVEGLAVLDGLVEAYWKNLFPARMHGRKSAVALVVRHLESGLKGYQPGLEDRVPLERALALIKRLQAFLHEAMQGEAPELSGLQGTLKTLLDRAPEPHADEDHDKGQEPDGGKGDQRKGQEPDDGKLRSGAEARRSVFEAAAFLQAQDPKNPVAYRLRRVLYWGALKLPSHEDGKTMIQPPSNFEHARVDLTGLLGGAQHATLLERAEAYFQEETFHYWLDLQRLVAVSMEALGESFQEARDALIQETALLLRRLPGLPPLTFLDGTPFADSLTEDWIVARVMPVLGHRDGESEAGPAGQEDKAPLDVQYEEARRRLASGDLAGALAVLQEQASQDASQQDRFRRRLYLALLCAKANQPAIACPVLESLDEEVERHGLEAWDPALTLEVWSTLYKCYEALGKAATPDKEVLRARAGRVFDKICRLDAGYALRAFGIKS